MAEVVHALAAAPDEDVYALAHYFAGLMKDAPDTKDTPLDNLADATKSSPEGATLFAGACSACHQPGAPMLQQGRPSLSWSTPLRLDDPQNALSVIVHGLTPKTGHAGPEMPAFGNDFTDHQLTEIAAYLRARFTDRPAWSTLDRAIDHIRQEDRR
jgi:nicotinate dehydrogenase subunit B